MAEHIRFRRTREVLTALSIVGSGAGAAPHMLHPSAEGPSRAQYQRSPYGFQSLSIVPEHLRTRSVHSAETVNQPITVVSSDGTLSEAVLPDISLHHPNLTPLSSTTSTLRTIAKQEVRILRKERKTGSADFLAGYDRVQGANSLVAFALTKVNGTYDVATSTGVEEATWQQVNDTTWKLQPKNDSTNPYITLQRPDSSDPTTAVTLAAGSNTLKAQVTSTAQNVESELDAILSGQDRLHAVDAPKQQPVPTPQPDSYNIPNPDTIDVIPVNIPGFSTVDPAQMQQQLNDSAKLYKDYGFTINYNIMDPLNISATQISQSDQPCSDNFAADEYNYVKRRGLLGDSKQAMLYNNFSNEQCDIAEARDGRADGAVSGWDGSGKGQIKWSVVNLPENGGGSWATIPHETGRQLGLNQGDLASCDTADCVASAKPDVDGDVMGFGSDHGMFNLTDETVLGLHPNVESITQGDQTLTIEPRAQMDQGLKGIKLPFTVNGQVEGLYVGLRAPVGGDSNVATSQVIAGVWDGKLGAYDADIDTELPPLDAGQSVGDPTDGWTLTADSISSSSAQLHIVFSK